MLRDQNNRAFPPDYAEKLGEVFVRIDACLTDAVHYLDPVTHVSAFASRIADGVPTQHQISLNGLDNVRAAMHTIVQRHGIALPRPATSAINACRLRISEAILAASELDPRNWSGPQDSSAPKLSDDLEEDASRIVNHLMTLLDTMQASLTEDWNGKRNTRAMSQQPNSAESCGHPLVRELERMTTVHGLCGLHRRTVDFARHRACGDVVVGFFGAVSAGKSSLINGLLGSALMPVAVLPTTTVPVEIRHGRAASGMVEFVAAKPERIQPGRIAEFVDYHYNRANERQVTRIVLEAPAPLLASGVTLIDTPGIDFNLATEPSGGVAALWCDLAIVLISATAPLTLREAVLVRELCSRGARVAVLVTKVDLIEADDRWRIYDHVVDGLWQRTRLEVPVYLTSTCEDDPPRRRAWVDGPLSDTLAQCRDQRVALRTRQLAALRRDVLDALQIRVLWRSPVALDDEQVNETIGALSTLRDAIAAEIRSPTFNTILVDRTMADLTNEIAHNAAALWSQTHDSQFDATRLVELAINARAHALAGVAIRKLETLHARVNIALQHAANTFGAARLPPALPSAPWIAPAFVFDQSLPATLLPGSLGRVIGRLGFYLSARKSVLHSASMAIAQQSLSTYLALLNGWTRSSLATLLRALDEHIARIQTARKRNDPETASIAQQLRRDIARLRSAEPR